MGSENTPLDADAARHLLRRATFGAPKGEVDRLLASYGTRGAAADRLLGFRPRRTKPRGRIIEDKINGWLKIMIKTKYPLQEKLVLFWHDHFATSNDKVDHADAMADQNGLLREHAAGDLRALLKAMNRNAAMIEFLDTNRNTAQQPNENYAREFQELFTLGAEDFAGNSNYEQRDIVEIARAFTGWGWDRRSGKSYFDSGRHDRMADHPARGDKHVYKGRAPFGAGGASLVANGEGGQEADTVVDVVLSHQDSDGKNTVARRICRRLFEYFVSGRFADRSDPYVVTAVDAAITESGFGMGGAFDIRALVRAILVSDAFYDGAATPQSVKMPVDFVMGTLRMLDLNPKARDLHIEGGAFESLSNQLANMGQLPMYPPSVFGWDWEAAWVSSTTLLARCAFARDVSCARNGPVGGTRLVLERLFDTTLTSPGDVVDDVAAALALTGRLTAGERAILIDYLTDDGARPAIDYGDDFQRRIKISGLIALLLQSPAYQMH